MIPIRLYIENFMCHQLSDFKFDFNSALIVGRIENNDLYSNGVGKSSIFKAIEYVLFNQVDCTLDKIIRDESDFCKVSLDFEVNSLIYRITRIRSKKGNSDISLFEKNGNGSQEEIDDINSNKKIWKDLSGRRSQDTENSICNLIKVNFKSFRNTVHFVQNDFSGLALSTPEKRKTILKDTLNLVAYTKLEKIAKEKYNAISKSIEKNNTIIETLGNPIEEINNLNNSLSALEINLNKKIFDINQKTNEINKLNNDILDINNKIISIELLSKLTNQKNIKLSAKNEILKSKNNNDIKIKNLLVKKNSLNKEIDLLKNNNYSSDNELLEVTNNLKLLQEQNTNLSLLLKLQNSKYEELKIPLPNNAICKHCRQNLSEEHKINCKSLIDLEIKECLSLIKGYKKSIEENINKINNFKSKIFEFNNLKSKFENSQISINLKLKDVENIDNLHNEYLKSAQILDKELGLINNEILSIEEELSKNSINEYNFLQEKINSLNISLRKENNNFQTLNQEINYINNEKAILNHKIEIQINNKNKKEILEKENKEVSVAYNIYPQVLQAFSSNGIPNLIIQNVLDDLQTEANNLLNQLKPGLQLLFFVEKTKSDGTQDDTLDIKYLFNNKTRDYDQLSGAMKLAITFSLKLGLSFLLQKISGSNIKLLLLDEIDQSLDKASVDAFADIVKFFQNEFKILVITHNDRLKDKFSHILFVEQDINMISKARLMIN